MNSPAQISDRLAAMAQEVMDLVDEALAAGCEEIALSLSTAREGLMASADKLDAMPKH